MKFEAFEQRAAELWREIPREYQAGVDGLRVERGAHAHPSLDGVYTLGECVTEAYPSDWGGPDTIRSQVVLYYGSFWRLSREDPEFDWEGELWETLTHELQHHLESLAAEDDLEHVDYAADEHFKRLEGEAFDPWYYRAAESLGGGWYRIEDEYFAEQVQAGDEVVAFEWEGEAYRVRLPAARADVTYVNVVGGVASAPRSLTLVLSRRRGVLAALRVLLQRSAPQVEEFDADAERVTE